MRVRVDLQAACGRIGVTLLAGLAVFAVRHPRVQAERPRRRLVAIIAGADRDGHALVVQLVRGGDGDIERIAVEVREAQRLGDAVLGERFQLPHVLVCVAVVRVVARLGMILVDRRAVVLAVEVVFAVLDAVRPRREDVAAAGRRQVVRSVAAEHLLAAVVETAQLRAELADDGGEIAMMDGILVAGTRCGAHCLLHDRR